MTSLLLVVIYIAFIGLGIPDSVFGSAWPAIYSDWNLPVSTANFVTGLTTCGTVIASFFCARIIKRFGTANITFFSTLLTAIALFGCSLSPSIYWFCLFAIPSGFGAGAIDAALNDYVALHYSASHMNFLHCFYGVGVSLSPYVMSLALSGDSGWRGGYRLVFLIQISIAIITLVSIPLWKKCAKIHTTTETVAEQKLLSFKELLKLKGIKVVLVAFFTSCSIECVCGIWGSTYLVENLGMKPHNAAKMVVIYYMGIALGRFMSGVFSSKVSSKNLILIGTTIMSVSVVLLVLSCGLFLSNMYLAAIGLFLIGFGNAPIYPNFMHLAPKNFGEEISTSVIGVQQASASVAFFASPIIFGFLAEGISIVLYPFFALFMLTFFVTAILKFIKESKN